MNYKDSDYNTFVQDLKNTELPHLSLFIGLFNPDKKKAVKEMSGVLNKEVSEFDFNDIVSKNETDTFEAIDDLFQKAVDSDDILYFLNGDKLCGAYTGFTHSKVKYATPQERYFLKKAGEYSGLVIINITEPDSADETILRAADSLVKFPLPNSPIRRILWHLRNYSLHGYDIRTKRPEIYDEASPATN